MRSQTDEISRELDGSADGASRERLEAELRKEARRQSLKVAELSDEDQEWMDAMDDSGWRG